MINIIEKKAKCHKALVLPKIDIERVKNSNVLDYKMLTSPSILEDQYKKLLQN